MTKQVGTNWKALADELVARLNDVYQLNGEEWSAEEQRKIQSQAVQMFSESHYPGCKGDPDNCGACAIRMEHPEYKSPNYSGFARLYVEARRTMKASWLCQELADNDNEAYKRCLIKSINTFGVSLTNN